MANTKIVLPAPATTIWTVGGGNVTPTAVLPQPSEYTTWVSDIILWLPYYKHGKANVSSLAHNYGGLASGTPKSIKGWKVVSNVPTALHDSIVNLNNGSTLLVPVTGTLSTTVDIARFVTALATPSPSILPFSSSPGHPSAPASSTPNLGSTSTAPSASRTTSPNSSHKPTPTSSSSSNGISAGGVAGGVIGGFIGGALIATLVFFLCFRRRRTSRRGSTHGSSGSSSNGKPIPMAALGEDRSQGGMTMASITGWQKHLPQEKDDRTLTNAFHSIFDNVQTYIEGFYESKSGPPPGAAIQKLGKLSSDDTPQLLLKTNGVLPVLQGVLTRYIVHRISGRSKAEESFLPPEFTAIPAKNNWHMENNDGEKGSNAERKRGFPQAFSQWRRLTGFLGVDPRTDEGSQRDLNSKIQNAVQALDAAFAPWERSGTSKSNRMKSLREILLQAAEAGYLLFTQPSTFMFDWSNRSQDRAMVVSPALVKRLDEHAEAFSQEQVLLEARREGI